MCIRDSANAVWRTLGALRRWALSTLAACQPTRWPLEVPNAVAGPLLSTLSEWGVRSSDAPHTWVLPDGTELCATAPPVEWKA
eukprot:10105089-Alexandrium_andersonii.AAC.1